MLERHGAKVHSESMVRQNENQAYMIGFNLEGDEFRIVEMVLPVKDERDITASRRQAVTRVHHRVKQLLMDAEIYGAKSAMVQYLVDPDSKQTMGELVLSAQGLKLPATIQARIEKPFLPAGPGGAVIIEGTIIK